MRFYARACPGFIQGRGWRTLCLFQGDGAVVASGAWLVGRESSEELFIWSCWPLRPDLKTAAAILDTLPHGLVLLGLFGATLEGFRSFEVKDGRLRWGDVYCEALRLISLGRRVRWPSPRRSSCAAH